MLVLFTSWRLCFQVEELLDAAVREVTLVQGQKPLAALLNDHELATATRARYPSYLDFRVWLRDWI